MAQVRSDLLPRVQAVRDIGAGRSRIALPDGPDRVHPTRLHLVDLPCRLRAADSPILAPCCCQYNTAPESAESGLAACAALAEGIAKATNGDIDA
jgi:hypothetical protein